MLEIKNIKKTYHTGEFSQIALNDVSLKFRNNEFVAVLGPSGSGKTTLLNILGGLDRYDEGDLIINNKSTKKFTDKDWDAYRNNCIGFIFQSYNLINHISILANVEMALTLSGVSAKKRKRLAKQALERVGLKDHINKRPNELSGGQMQRVAIARSLVNNPDIILADEPTGALDSRTSTQIMELIKDIAKEKLVIMVTHNEDIASTYATRIVKMKDGVILEDSNPLTTENTNQDYVIRKTKMSFLTALKLSFNNIRTKKGRTFLTALASSIGIIGISLILSLSNGFDKKIDEFETDSLSNMPIVIAEQGLTLDEETMNEIRDNVSSGDTYITDEVIKSLDIESEMPVHKNVLNADFYEYVQNLDEDLTSGTIYGYYANLNTLIKQDDEVKLINLANYTTSFPIKKSGYGEFLLNNFDILKGHLPENKNEIVLIVDNQNRLPKNLLESLGFKDETVSFTDIMKTEIKVVLNNDFYSQFNTNFIMNIDLNKVYNSKNNVTLKISGIIRGKEDKEVLVGASSGIAYDEELINYVIDNNCTSEIVKLQKDVNYNVLTGEKFTDEAAKTSLLAYLGATKEPAYYQIFPKDFSSKEKIISYLDKYNEGKTEEEKVIYIDESEILTSLSGSIMDAITIVLVAFSSISLIVSSIMIGIITYISVLERTKEIGILRALGARKKDITRVFNAETFIIGLSSGLLGIFISYLLTFPVNRVIENLSDLPNVASLSLSSSLILITVSIILTLIGGFIPAKVASRKDPVVALRTE